jgi:hypothetical protein
MNRRRVSPVRRIGEPTPAERKQRALEHYARLDAPNRFVQLDGFAAREPDCVMRPDADGDCLFSGRTEELFGGGWDVRVLMSEGVTPEAAVRLLRKLADWVERDPEWTTERGDELLF